MCFPPQLLQYAIKALPILCGTLLLWPAGGSTKHSQSSLPHSCYSFYLCSLPNFLHLTNSYTSFRPRSRTISPVRLLQVPRLGSVPIHPLRASVHFSLPLSKSHHIILEVSTDMSVSGWYLPLDGRGQVSLFLVLLASRTVPAHSKHSLHVHWTKQNRHKEV